MEVATSLAVKDVAIFEIGEVQVITVYPLPVQWIEAASRVSMHKGSHSAMSTHVEAHGSFYNTATWVIMVAAVTRPNTTLWPAAKGAAGDGRP
jgi:hypothetical protein